MFRIALISKWHPHYVRYVEDLRKFHDCAIPCVWDEDPERGRAWAEELGVDFEPDYSALLMRADVDGVCITAPTAMHKELCVAAARAGKHVFTEKTLALTEKDALEVKEAVEGNKVIFSIAYIQRTVGMFLFARKLAESGLLGDVTMMRIRNNVDSACTDRFKTTLAYWLDMAPTGGGAMTDLGCHPMYLLQWFLGDPESVVASFGYYLGRECEDSASAVFTFRGGKALGMTESSYATPYRSMYEFSVYGTKGAVTIRSCDGFVEVQLPKSEQPWFSVDTGVICENAETYNLWRIPADSLPNEAPPIRQWIDECAGKAKTLFTVDEAVILSRMVEGANKAGRSGYRHVFAK